MPNIFSHSYNLIAAEASQILPGFEIDAYRELSSLTLHHNALAGFLTLQELDDCKYNFDVSFNSITNIHTGHHERACLGKNTALMAMNMGNQAASTKRRYISSSIGLPPPLDDQLHAAGGVSELLETPFVPSPDGAFQKVEYPAGSKIFPFSCTQWVGRKHTSAFVQIDPTFYEYTGGSTGSLRMKWFDVSESNYELYKARFGQDEGFCRCDAPWLGVPPLCKLSCGRGYYRDSRVEDVDKQCKKCPAGTSCDGLLTNLNDIPLLENWWRVSNVSVEVKPCPPNRYAQNVCQL